LTAGLRYDYASMSMQNNLGQNTTVNSFYQLADTSVNFSRLSPKLGLTWAVSESSHAFASYNQGFRTPSENQLFRSGATALTAAAAAAALRPILAEQFEIGVRGEVQRWSYELVAYQLKKQDDLLAQRDSSGVTVQTNNGSTEHQGVELGLGREIAPKLRLDLAASYAKHRYHQWSGFSNNASFNYSGNEIENSPRLLANLRLTWRPVAGTQAQLEWVELGSYYLEATNLQGKYDGHRLFNARISTQLDQHWSCFARLTNLTDERYADSASYSSSMAMYSPGLPRAVYLGVQRTW
jgi:iron complex outermembrane recepter protein